MPGERALLLLDAAETGLEQHSQEDLPVGRRDAALLRLRSRLFGEQISGLTPCPHCGERLEMNFRVNDILIPAIDDAPAELSMRVGEYQVSFRIPNALDMAALDRAAEQLLDRWLLQRCLLTAQQGDEAFSAVDLPQDVVDAIASRMAEADPQAQVELSLTCPACGAHASVLFDIVAFLWREIEAWGIRTLNEVHLLASAYGWSEREILALSPWRRQFYLERIGA